jgi:outer membrane protein
MRCMCRTVFVRACAAIIVMIGIAVSTASSQQKMALTINDAIRLGLDNSKILHASQMRVQVADARASEVSAARLPSLRANAGYTRLSDVAPFAIALPGSSTAITVSPNIENNYSLRATLTQPLFTGFRLDAGVRAADANAQASEHEYSRDRSELVYNVKSAYWTLYKAMEVKKVIDENVEQVQAHLVDAQNLSDQGLATANDVLKIQVQLSTVKLAQIDAKNMVWIARVNLNNQMGIPLTTNVELSTTIWHNPVEFGSLDQLVAQAVESRPDLKAMQARVEASDAAVTAAQSGWWPQISLQANYMNARPNTRIFPSKDQFTDTWDVGLNISLDLWNWGTTAHQTAEAKAQYQQTLDGFGSMKDGAELEVTQNYLTLQQAKEKIAVAKQGVEQAEENYRVTNDKYKEGLSLTTDLLDADVALAQAKTSYTQALVDYELAEARLERSIGQ